MKICVLFLFCLSITFCSAQGIYAPPVGQVGSTAIYKDSSVIINWASSCVVTRGYQQINNVALGFASSGTDINGTGKANGQPVSLGDSGVAILQFPYPITNGVGYDFVVYENAFNNSFLELAFVEVSSDGINYFRFNNYSTTPDTAQVGTFGNVDATHIHNLAGKYEALYGTPFNLDDVPNDGLLNKNAITHIKLIDVIGNITDPYPTFDTDNNKVNDPWPTPFPSSGFDLDAVGVIHENASSINEQLISFSIYPNPVNDIVNIQYTDDVLEANIYSLSGELLISGNQKVINMETLTKGIYILKLKTKKGIGVKRIIKN